MLTVIVACVSFGFGWLARMRYDIHREIREMQKELRKAGVL